MLLFEGAADVRLPSLFFCAALVGGPRLRGLSFSRGDRLLEQLLYRHTVTIGDFRERRVLGFLRTELDSSEGVTIHADLLCRVLDGEPTLRSQKPQPVRKRLLRHALLSLSMPSMPQPDTTTIYLCSTRCTVG